jgi:hypothetical protein
MAYGLWSSVGSAIKATVWQVFAPAKPAFPPSLAVTHASACDMHGRINAAGAWMRKSGLKLATQSAEPPEGPEGRALRRTVAALHFLPRATAIAYMDVGEGREPGAEALPAKRVLHLHASGHAETICHYSEVP